MSFYAIYNPELKNSLVGILDEFPLSLTPPLVAKAKSGSPPDLTRYEWNPATLMFDRKTLRRLSKLEFIGRFSGSYVNILNAAKVNTDIEMFVKMLDWATPDADGTSIDLDDPRVVGALQMLEAAGIVPSGTTASVLE
jgi:hypothetical protein